MEEPKQLSPADGILDVLPGYLHRKHVTIVNGDPYAGKSRFLFWSSHRLALGLPGWWGHLPPLRVLLCTERTRRMIVTQALGLSIDSLPENLRIFTIGDRDRNWYNDFVTQPLVIVTREMINGWHPDIVIIDTLMHFVNPTSSKGGVNDYTSMMLGLTELQIWAHTYDISVVAVHHAPKEKEGEGYKKATSRILGSQAIAGSTASVWTVSSLTDGDDLAEKYLKIEFSTHAAYQPAVLWFKAPKDSPFIAVSQEEAEGSEEIAKSLGSVQSAILRTLPLEFVDRISFVNSLALELKKAPQNVHRALRTMCKPNGEVEQEIDPITSIKRIRRRRSS